MHGQLQFYHFWSRLAVGTQGLCAGFPQSSVVHGHIGHWPILFSATSFALGRSLTSTQTITLEPLGYN